MNSSSLRFLLNRFIQITVVAATLVLIIAADNVTRADQCASLNAEQEKKAAPYLHVGDTIVQYCEPCKTDPYKIVIKKIDGVSINGKGMDIAYIYVAVGKPDATGKIRFKNLAALAGCPTKGVSPELTINPASLKEPPEDDDDWGF